MMIMTMTAMTTMMSMATMINDDYLNHDDPSDHVDHGNYDDHDDHHVFKASEEDINFLGIYFQTHIYMICKEGRTS